MYNLYGRYIGKKTFNLTQAADISAVAIEDGVDYMPTKTEVIFGHHVIFIAGTTLILAFATEAGGKGAPKLWPRAGAVDHLEDEVEEMEYILFRK